MKCRDIEKMVYLYDELTAREREETDAHLKSCESCSIAMQHVIQLQKVVASHRAQLPSMHSTSLTSRVINAISENRSKHSTLWEQFISSVRLSPLRYSLAALSIFLVSTFALESADRGEVFSAQKPYHIVSGPKTSLNLATFHSAFLKKKEAPVKSPSLFRNCLAACLRNAVADCEQCSNKFIKHDQSYEK